MSITNILTWARDRAAEPSSLAGVAAVLSAIGTVLANPADAQAWGVVIAGVLAVVLRERGAAAPVTDDRKE